MKDLYKNNINTNQPNNVYFPKNLIITPLKDAILKITPSVSSKY